MSRIRIHAVSAAGSDRRMDIAEPPNAARSCARAEQWACAKEAARWRRAWAGAWRGPALSRSDLIARARLAISDAGVMTEDETVRLARDVVSILGGGPRI